MNLSSLTSNFRLGLVLLLGALSFLLLDPGISLFLGLLLAITFPAGLIESPQKYYKLLLPICVIGLGFGMKLSAVLQAGSQGLAVTAFTIVATLLLGVGLGKVLKVDNVTAYLVAVGTAICGGSAIAAVGPVVRAKSSQLAISLGAVFVLNAIALVIFPLIGRELNLGDADFGLWAAIAIHDTSSVVGAATSYSNQALEIAVPTKLARALWIIPLVWFSQLLYSGQAGQSAKTKFPWFIIFFLVASLVGTAFPSQSDHWQKLFVISKKGLSLTLFLIGLSLSLKALKEVGYRPLLLAVLLWAAVSVCSLLLILKL